MRAAYTACTQFVRTRTRDEFGAEKKQFFYTELRIHAQTRTEISDRNDNENTRWRETPKLVRDRDSDKWSFFGRRPVFVYSRPGSFVGFFGFDLSRLSR